jgi:hypothetical protein
MMPPLKKLWNGIRWFAPIHRWTAAITLAFIGGTLLWIMALGLGLTHVARAPGEVAVAMYQAAQDGQPSEVRKYLSDDAKEQFDLLRSDETTALLDLLSRESTTTVLSSLGVRNYGRSAVTGLIQEMSDGLSELRVEVLVREGRFWRVEWPIGDADWFESVRRFDPYYEFVNTTNDRS